MSFEAGSLAAQAESLSVLKARIEAKKSTEQRRPFGEDPCVISLERASIPEDEEA